MIALYRGTSFVSRAIRWYTWGEYSHASWVTDRRGEIEAWRRGGVQKVETLGANHTPGTEIDLFRLPRMDDVERMRTRAFLEDQLGKSYDFMGLARFVTRGREDDQGRWFCSELVAEACLRAGFPLFRDLPSWKVHPNLLSHSVLLEPCGTVKAGEIVKGTRTGDDLE